jgi:bifunctional UDP-N-acetylglucosamine pyrophosphorylase / glucosamine-1-phosphate N-acetyltransferase
VFALARGWANLSYNILRINHAGGDQLHYLRLSEKKMKITPVVLAAGQGTRMHSKLPKVLHPLLGRPMVWYALQTVRLISDERPVMVIGHGGEEVREVLDQEVEFVVQEPQLGTAHAVKQVEPILSSSSDVVVVTCADMPLLQSDTLKQMVQAHLDRMKKGDRETPITLLTVVTEEARGFGRIFRNQDGDVHAIIEENDASPEQVLIKELNAGIYCFSAGWLWQALERIPLSSKGEYYLTDLAALAVSDGLKIQALNVADPTEVIGINTRLHLAEAESILRNRKNQELMKSGVTLVDPSTAYIETQVEIGRDTVIWPNTFLQGETTIGESCTIGPNAIVRNSRFGDRCQVYASVIEGAVVEEDVDIGPFAHLRAGAHLAKDVHIGNFGEIKESYLGPGSKMGHFSYVGNTTVGAKTNIGAGTITCNYDGERKHPTIIGENVFIGSDTMLVAPVKIGDRARTGAGSVVTKDVPEDSLAVGIPARVIRKFDKSG